MNRIAIAFIVLCSCASSGTVVDSGQTSTNQNRCATGIEGRTTGMQGWIITNANIRLINRQTKQAMTVQTDANGEYLACLQAGTYDVLASVLGYKPARRKSIKVVAPGRNVVDIVMKPSGLFIVDSLHP
jgi:hypothetical protein